MIATIQTKHAIRAWIIGMIASIGVVGCAQSNDRGMAVRPVTLAEFAKPKGTAAGEPQRALNENPPQATAGPVSAADLSEEVAGPVSDDDPAPRAVLRFTRPGQRIIVDSLVGEVNGRPIFADEFLEPIEERLRRAAEQTSGPQREVVLRAIVTSWLRDVVLDALILAEAEASLTVAQQQGLFALIRNWQEEVIRRGGGTRFGIESSLRQEGYGTLKDYMRRQEELLLVNELRRRKIKPRVIVSWRDIEREYQRRYDEFNPPATVTLARIRLSNEDQADLITQVKHRLAGGESFAEIADELGFPNGGVWETFKMGDGGISDIEVSEQMKADLAGLGPGQTSEPFTQGSATVWLNIVSVDRPPGITLYDDPQVQRRLGEDIRKRRNKQEWDRYVNSLLDRGSYNELDDMAERLYRIALLRYGR